MKRIVKIGFTGVWRIGYQNEPKMQYRIVVLDSKWASKPVRTFKRRKSARRFSKQ